MRNFAQLSASSFSNPLSQGNFENGHSTCAMYFFPSLAGEMGPIVSMKSVLKGRECSYERSLAVRQGCGFTKVHTAQVRTHFTTSFFRVGHQNVCAILATVSSTPG